MNDSDNIKMTINIGGEHLQLSVPFNRQDIVRDAEKSAATLYDSWRRKWPSRSDKEILAMIAYQFASYYVELLARYENAADLADKCNRRLSEIINDTNSDSSLS